MGLKKSSEPILALRYIYSVIAGGGTAVAAVDLSALPAPVRVALPALAALAVQCSGWIDRRYVSPAYNAAHRAAESVGVELPSEAALVADVAKVIDATPVAPVVAEPAA